ITHTQLSIGADQFPQPVPVPPIKTFDVEFENALQLWIGLLSRLLQRSVQFSEFRARALEGCLDTTDGRIHEFRAFFQSVIKTILQQDGSPLLGRQAGHEMFDRASNPKHLRYSRLESLRNHRLSFSFHSYPAFSEKVDTAVMGNAK